MTLKSTYKLAVRVALTVVVFAIGLQIWSLSRFLVNYPSDFAALLGVAALVVLVVFTPYVLHLIWRKHEIQGKLGE